MPKQTVIINVTSVASYEAGAELCSYVAYPDPAQAVERGRYQVALSRWAITERVKIDKDWALGAQIKPSIFAQSEQFFLRCYSDGTSLLANRAVCATAMVSPFLTGKPRRIDEGLPPTVENICTAWIAEALGYAPGSFKTIEANIWAPTKPIAHLAAALGLWHIGFQSKNKQWDKEHDLFNKFWVPTRLFLGILFYPDILKVIIDLAEDMRLRMLGFNTFKRVREDDTIQFVIV